jgi:Holliday junction DNA helicase RuvB
MVQGQTLGIESLVPNARSRYKSNLSPFLGATTRSGLTAPMRARFGIQSRIYNTILQVLSTIVERSAEILKVPITQDAIH